jgi:hypothetical protein
VNYTVIVRDRRGETRYIEEYLLDGLVPDRVVALMTCEIADALGLCKICDSGGSRCHVLVWIAPHTFKKYCPVLWHDAFKPASWKVGDLA